MGKAKPRKLREMIQAEETQQPSGGQISKQRADATKRPLQGAPEVMVSEICDSILDRLNQPEQPSRNQERRKTKLDENSQ